MTKRSVLIAATTIVIAAGAAFLFGRAPLAAEYISNPVTLLVSPAPDLEHISVVGAQKVSHNEYDFKATSSRVTLQGKVSDTTSILLVRYDEPVERSVSVDSHGRFKIPVDLRGGSNDLSLTLSNTSGLVHRQSIIAIYVTRESSEASDAYPKTTHRSKSPTINTVSPRSTGLFEFRIDPDNISFHAVTQVPVTDWRFQKLEAGEYSSRDFFTTVYGELVINDQIWEGAFGTSNPVITIKSGTAHVQLESETRTLTLDLHPLRFSISPPPKDALAQQTIRLVATDFRLQSFSPQPSSMYGSSVGGTPANAISWGPRSSLTNGKTVDYRIDLAADNPSHFRLLNLAFSEVAGDFSADWLRIIVSLIPAIWLIVLARPGSPPSSASSLSHELIVPVQLIAAGTVIGPAFFSFFELGSRVSSIFQWDTSPVRIPHTTLSLMEPELLVDAGSFAVLLFIILLAMTLLPKPVRRPITEYLYVLAVADAAILLLAMLNASFVDDLTWPNLGSLTARLISTVGVASFFAYIYSLVRHFGRLRALPISSMLVALVICVILANVSSSGFSNQTFAYALSYGTVSTFAHLSSFATPTIVLTLAAYLLGARQEFAPDVNAGVRLMIFAGFLVGPTAGWLNLPFALLLAVFLYPYIVEQQSEQLSLLWRKRSEIASSRGALLQFAANNSPKVPFAKDDEKKNVRTVFIDEQQYDASELGLAFGPFDCPTKNAYRALRVACVLGVPLTILYFVPTLFNSRLYVAELPLLTMLSQFVQITVPWLLGAFFFGYFYPSFRGRFGWEKGIRIAAGLSLSIVPFELMHAVRTLDVSAIVFAMAQRFAFYSVLGFWAFDYLTIRRTLGTGLSARAVMNASGVTVFGGFGQALVASAGVGISSLLAGGLTKVLALVAQTLVPAQVQHVASPQQTQQLTFNPSSSDTLP